MSRPSIVSLAALCDRITDGTHQPPKFSDAGVPFIFVSNIGNGRIDLKTSKFITRGQHQELTQRCPIEPGDVLYTTVGSYGNAAQVLGSAPFAFQRHIAHLKPRGDLVAPAYLVAVLNSAIVKSQVDRLVRGVAQKTLNLAALKAVRVPLPSLPEQRRIADILDRADTLRAKRRAALALLDTLTQSMFIDMFGDPATNPKRWPTSRLGDLIASGPQNGLYKPSTDYGSGTPILRIDGFYDGAVTDLRELKRVRLTDQERELFRLRADDVVINRVNSREYLGKSALIPALDEPTVFESNMMRFSLNRQVVEPLYVVASLQTAAVKTQILRSAKDAINQSSINQQDVNGIRLNIPRLDLQREFVLRVAAADKLKAAHRASLAQLDALFASLQHRAFRGEL